MADQYSSQMESVSPPKGVAIGSWSGLSSMATHGEHLHFPAHPDEASSVGLKREQEYLFMEYDPSGRGT